MGAERNGRSCQTRTGYADALMKKAECRELPGLTPTTVAALSLTETGEATVAPSSTWRHLCSTPAPTMPAS